MSPDEGRECSSYFGEDSGELSLIGLCVCAIGHYECTAVGLTGPCFYAVDVYRGFCRSEVKGKG